MKKISSTFVLFCAVLLFSGTAMAQEPKASPAETVTGKVNSATITIHYGSPSVKGREIFGKLEPFGAVWRAGANEATTFETDKNIRIGGEGIVGGQVLMAGTYSLFLIPKESGVWTVIFNKEPKQWGAFKYDETKDALRVEVKTKALPKTQERLVYRITKNGFELDWDKTSVPVSIK